MIEPIQTVSEVRKSRRRAQNRSAQQAFKQRKKKREKELVAQVDAAERTYRALEAEREQLREDLDRKKKERSSSMAGSTGRRDVIEEDQEQRERSV